MNTSLPRSPENLPNGHRQRRHVQPLLCARNKNAGADTPGRPDEHSHICPVASRRHAPDLLKSSQAAQQIMLRGLQNA